MKLSRSLPSSRRAVYLWDLLREMVSRDMKLRYKRSVFGLAWSLLNPLAQLVVLSIIFRYVLPVNIPNYTSFLFTALLVWNWFRASLSAGAGSIVYNRGMIHIPSFPATLLPVVSTASNFVHFALSLPVLFGLLLLNGIYLTPAVLALPVVIAIQFMFTLSLVYFLAAIHVSFRDVEYLTNIFLMLGFYLSPVFYDASRIPEKYQLLYRLNPMVDIIGSYRTILLDGRLPDLLPLLLIASVSSGLLWLGYNVFLNASYQFAEEL